MTKQKPRTYDASHKGKKIKVTIPDDLKDTLEDVLRENLSPLAVVAIASHLFAARTKDSKVNTEIQGFASLLVNLVGTTEYNNLLEELGL